MAKKRARSTHYFSVKYEFSDGPNYLTYIFGMWTFVANKARRARFSTKEAAQEALRQFCCVWDRPVGQNRPYVLVKCWKFGKRPSKPAVRIRASKVHDNETRPTGPWDREPQSLDWVSKKTGLPMMLRRSVDGHWLAYVGVPAGNYLYGARDESLVVHGNVSYCGFLPEEDGAAPGESYWWYGFHGGNPTDIIPSRPHRTYRESKYRTQSFMRKHCESLGEQIRRFDIHVL